MPLIRREGAPLGQIRNTTIVPPSPRVLSTNLVGMHGLGDNIYQRGYVKALAERAGIVWLWTPWPQLYADLRDVGLPAYADEAPDTGEE